MKPQRLHLIPNKTTLKVDFLHGGSISERKKSTNKKVMRLTGINGPAVYKDDEEGKYYQAFG